MTFEDMKERFQTEGRALLDKIQDSSAYIQLRERYENLSPNKQKLTLLALTAVVLFLVFEMPIGYFSSSSEAVSTFEDRRQLIRDMMKVTRDKQEAPQIAVPPDLNSLKSVIDSQLQAARLLPGQIRSNEVAAESVNLIQGNLLQGVLKISLLQLNLRQVLDLGFQLQSVSPSVKMTDLQMEANPKDPRYYDVTYKLAVLNVPNEPEAVAEEAPQPPPTKKKGK